MNAKTVIATVLFLIVVLLAIAALVFVVDCWLTLPSHSPTIFGQFRFAVGVVTAAISIFFTVGAVIFHGPKLVRWINRNRLTMQDLHVMLERRSSKKQKDGKPSTF